MNHFYVLGAELLEKFLICGCNVPIGFNHPPDCNIQHKPSFTWRKKKFDDKYITYGMKISFNDLIVPGCRKDILTMINKACNKQRNGRHQLSIAGRTWPMRWMRGGDKGRGNVRGNKHQHRGYKFSYPMQPIFNPSIWTPNEKDTVQVIQNYDVISFSYHWENEIERCE